MVHIEQGAAPPAPSPPAYAEEFKVFYHEHRRVLFGTAKYEGAGVEEAKDAVHDVMEDLLKRWPTVDSPLAYARRAIRNLVIKRLQRERRFLQRHFPGGAQLLDTVDDGVDDHDLVASETRQSVADLLADLADLLTPTQREAFTLYINGLSYAEIAEQTGNKQNNVRQLIHKSRERLKPALERYGLGAKLRIASPVPAQIPRKEGTW